MRMSAADDSGGIYHFTRQCHQDRAIDPDPQLPFPQTHGVVQRLDNHHAIEQTVLRRRAGVIRTDQIDRPAYDPSLIRKCVPPGTGIGS